MDYRTIRKPSILPVAVLFLWIAFWALPGCRMPGILNDLDGTWSRVQTNGHTRLETWERAPGGTLHGLGLRVNGTDTVHLESLVIRRANGHWTYEAIVPDQNSGMPIPFTCKSLSRDEAVFENPSHDFPQRIAYKLNSASKRDGQAGVDSLIVTLGTMTETSAVLRFTRR